ncbi:PspC domain-containing protein [Myxococcaceae bacterium JPH2]|nr:PspC domain-containing protein [Myxococcaceae bacterium JPH2]
MEGTKRCTACSKELGARVVRCPECHERLIPMHRGEGRTLLGACAALARELNVDPALVRVAFMVTLAVSGGTALLVYLLLCGFTPAAQGGTAPLQRLVDWLARVGNAPVDEAPRYERRV